MDEPARLHRFTPRPGLPAGAVTMGGQELPLPADMLCIFAGGTGKARGDQGQLSDSAPDPAMPPVGWVGDR